MANELRGAIDTLIREKGGNLVREALVKAGDQEAIKAFDNIQTAVVDYVTQWVENRIKQTDEKVEHLARIVEDVAERLQTERRKRLKIEADVLANVVMISGIEIHQAAKDAGRSENTVETMQKTYEFLSTVKIEKHLCGIVEAVRLPQRQIVLNGQSTLTTTIRVKFNSFTNKLALYKALAAHSKKSSKIRVQDAIPADLMNDKRELEKVGAKWRKENPDLRTRVICKNGEMQIYTKEKDQTKYNKVPSNVVDQELNAEIELPRAASPIITRSARGGRGSGRGGRGRANLTITRSSKRPRIEYDFSQFEVN